VQASAKKTPPHAHFQKPNLVQALPKVRRSMKEVSPMEDKTIYLLAELTILPGFPEEVKAIFKEALIPTLQEPGSEALYETGRKDDPHKLVFFEVFSSAAMSALVSRHVYWPWRLRSVRLRDLFSASR
jgi:quinol monooxygenase YgiN